MERNLYCPLSGSRHRIGQLRFFFDTNAANICGSDSPNGLRMTRRCNRDPVKLLFCFQRLLFDAQRCHCRLGLTAQARV